MLFQKFKIFKKIFLFSECESLVRKMLVRDPNKRYTLKQVRKHPWMRADIKAAEAAKEYTKPRIKTPPIINEQILRVMQSLGIDPVRTADSVKNDSYDHHAAIYFLLADKLSNVPKTKPVSMGSMDNRSMDCSGSAVSQNQNSPGKVPIKPSELNVPEHQKRRPSTIAEQATLDSYNPTSSSAKDFQGLRERNINPVVNPAPHPTAFTGSAKQPIPPVNQPHRWKTPAGADITAPTMMTASGMSATEYTCLTCGQPILENTTSTTSCVKCARLRTRRRNFATTPATPGVVLHPAPMQTPSIEEPVIPAKIPAATKIRNDSRDSGVSSGSSQDYDLTTPPIEKALIFPVFPNTTGRPDKPSIPFSQLVRKLSEVEGITPNISIMGGKTSLDEGVGLEVDQSHLQKLTILQNVR